MNVWLAVAAGGALGSLARYGVHVLATRALGTPSPYATAIVNIVGCLCIGLIAGVAAGSGRVTTSAWAFAVVGVLGGFTTFSSFGYDTFLLLQQGRTALAIGSVIVQVVVGLGAVALGYALASGR